VTRRLVVSAWLGFALAALFFYPLAVALDTDVYYLQWQRADAVEAGVVIGLLTAVFGALVYAIWPRSGRSALLALVAVAILPLASFAAGLARQLPFDDALRTFGDNRPLLFGAAALVAALAVAGLVLWPAGSARWFRRLLILVSPVSLVVVESLMTSAAPATPIIVSTNADPIVKASTSSACKPVLALLFDELSFSYLHDDTNQIREEYPAMRAFASQATNYLSVAAPGPETLVSMPSFLAARHLRNIRVDRALMRELGEDGEWIPFKADGMDALFPTARRLGFRTEIAGYYLPYCDMLRGLVDVCQSLSFYNVSSADADFSLADPVLTTFILWPRQFPLGLLKNPPFARLQRELVTHTAAFARRPMPGNESVFRFVHFSVPHLPFVFDANGYDPPFNPLRLSPDTAYVRQIGYVDRLFGDIIDSRRADGTFDQTTIILLADHGFRSGGRERDALHIPFIVKKAGQRERRDVTAPAAGELLLEQSLRDSCSP